MAKKEGGRKWLRCGCMGCLAVLALCVVIGAIFLGGAAYGVRSEKIEEQVLTPEIPVAPPVDGLAQGPEGIELAPGGRGEVLLDLRRGEFFIEPASAGDPLRVEARYDRSACEMVESLDEGADGAWSYQLRFSCGSGSLLSGLRRMLGGTTPEVRIFLPPDTELDLDLRLAQGDSKVELGGMWIDSARIDFEMGSVELGIDRPLRAPMEQFEIRGSMGELTTHSLGNASPRDLSVDFRMGGMELDLHGGWVGDSNVDLRFHMGGGVVLLPRDVRIEGVETDRVDPLSHEETDRPTLRFTTSSSQSGLQFVD